MISPKRLLQKWLGVEALAERVVNIELGRSSGFTTINYKGVPVDIDDDLLYQAIRLQDEKTMDFGSSHEVATGVTKGYEN